MSNATLAQGTLVKLGDGGSPENFSTIAEVKDVGGPDEKRATVDVTSHSSPNQTREFINGLRDTGSLKLKLVYLPGDSTQNGSTGIYAQFLNGTKANYKMVCPDSRTTTITFAALCVGHSKMFPVDKEMGADVDLKISGPVTVS